jgi:hypothetical protein
LIRYKYLHGPDGDFLNPFDKGWRRNCSDTCHPQKAAASPFVLRSEEGETAALLAAERGGA